MIGCTSANFHEGHRSEYLAHYVLSSLGTSVPVPGPEDTGLDLHCTLTERKGQRLWPRASYSVQVKSDPVPWAFESRDSVEWFVQHPLPIFLCVVEKKTCRIRMYHTLPRFYIWLLPPLPERLELEPGEGEVGQAVQWTDGTRFSLSAPILDFTIIEAQHPEIIERTRRVLQAWVDIEMENLRLVRNGIRSMSMPDRYRTNEPPELGVNVSEASHSLSRPSPEVLALTLERLRYSLDTLTSQLKTTGDQCMAFGASRAGVCKLAVRFCASEPLRIPEKNAEPERAVETGSKPDKLLKIPGVFRLFA